MTTSQWISIVSAAGLFVLLYFVFDTTPSKIESLEKTRSLSSEQTSAQVLIKHAKSALPASEVGSIELMEQELAMTQGDSLKVEIGKRLSSRWYQLKNPAISGHYAQAVAETTNTEEAWSIAGTTFSLCLQQTEEAATKDFCKRRAIQAFESAISINPEATSNKLNLALVYAEYPDAGNPMKGIKQLLTLNRANPEDVPVIKTLARLGLKTGQWEKAKNRLEKAKGLAPDDNSIDCMLAQAYEGLGDNAAAAIAVANCKN